MSPGQVGILAVLIPLLLVAIWFLVIAIRQSKPSKVQKSRATRIFLSLGWASILIFLISTLSLSPLMVLFLILGLFLLYWGLCGVVADVAKSKNRQWGLFYGLAALFTPFILIIVVSTFSTTTTTVDRRNSASKTLSDANSKASGYLPCPFCAEDVKVAAVLCKHCGSSLVISSE